MKMGISKDDIAPALGRADEVFIFQPADIPWLVGEIPNAVYNRHTGAVTRMR